MPGSEVPLLSPSLLGACEHSREERRQTELFPSVQSREAQKQKRATWLHMSSLGPESLAVFMCGCARAKSC